MCLVTSVFSCSCFGIQQEQGELSGSLTSGARGQTCLKGAHLSSGFFKVRSWMGQTVTDALCVFLPFSLAFFSIFGFSLGSVGFQGCWLMPGHWDPGPAGLIRYARDQFTPSQHPWPCCRRRLFAAGAQRVHHTPELLLCPGQSPLCSPLWYSADEQ